MRPLTFDSTNLDQVEAFVSKIYSSMRIGAVGADTRAQISRRVLAPGIAFDDLSYGFDIAYDAEPSDQLIVCDVVSSSIRRDGDGHGPAEVFGPGDQFLITRPGLPYSGLAHTTRLRFTVLDPQVLSRVAGTTNGGAAEAPVRVLDHRPVSRQAQARLQRCIAYVRDTVTAADVTEVPLLVASASQYLAASLLYTYPNTAVMKPGGGDRHDAGPSTLTRAIAFVETNPDQPLTLIDIAQAARVSPRAVQVAFQRHLGTTPTAYLRDVRLDHARHELRSAEAGTTVTSVAARWGFTPSRFTQLYRRTYGELPSQTLRG